MRFRNGQDRLRAQCDFDGVLFRDAVRFVAEIRSRRRSLVRNISLPLRRPGSCVRYLLYLLFVPRVAVRFTDDDDSLPVRVFRSQPGYLRAHHAVLALPDSVAAYLRGRSKQALRTNLTKARKVALHCLPVADADREGLVGRFSHELPPTIGADWSGQDWWSVHDADGCPRAFARVAVAEHTAVVLTLVAQHDYPLRSEARYLLHNTIVEHCIGRGVRHLVVENLLAATPGRHYFAARLGYRPACVVHRPGDRAPLAAQPG